MPDILAMIMAGGEGKRLYPLTRDRAKPAVPYGGRYRIIDLVLNNMVNSGIYHIKVLTQFKSDSLNKHINSGWRLSPTLGHYVDAIPAQMKSGQSWYQGTADAIHQNINLIEDARPRYVLVFGGDHIYKMDIRPMISYHVEKGADLTIAAMPVDINLAKECGVIQIDENWKIIGFQEKPDNPIPIPGQPDKILASLGNYAFNKDPLINILHEDSKLPDSQHDFGRNIIPSMIRTHNVYAYNFCSNVVAGVPDWQMGYWRDVGTVDAYWEANMELVQVTPAFNLYDQENWPIRTASIPLPPAKFVFANVEEGRIGHATDSLISEGCIISGGYVTKSVLSPGVRINSYSHVEESILFDGVQVGRYAKLKRVIVDKDVFIPEQMQIGYDLELDRKRFHVTEQGIVVVAKKSNLQEVFQN